MHAFATRPEPLVEYRHAPTEFAEVASMTMELFTLPHLTVFYPNHEDFARAHRAQLELVTSILPVIATFDSFQHWVYTHPDHTRDERRAAWLEVFGRFSPGLDWSGYEDAQATRWHQVLHVFEVPFYMIEYGIAQLGALQLWLQSRSDYREAVRRYAAALPLGGSRPLPELFGAAGINFAFDAKTIAPLADALAEELEKFPA